MNGLGAVRKRVAAIKRVEGLTLAQVLLPRVEPELGVRLGRALQAREDAADWSWLASPELRAGPVADALLALIPQAPAVEPRVELVCALARLAAPDARRWAFEQFLTHAYPLESSARGKVMGRHNLLTTLLAASPAEWGEEWIASYKLHGEHEILERNQFGIWPADAVDRVWSERWGTRRQDDLKQLLVLSPERRRLLADATRQLTGWQRLSSLSWFSDELTEAEVDEVVSTPWQAVNQPRRANEPEVIANHLRFIQTRALPRATPQRIQAWFERVLAMRSAYHQSVALAALLPHLRGAPRTQAEARLRGLRAKDELGVFDADVVAHLTDAELLPWAALIAAKPGHHSSEIFVRAQKGPDGLLEAVLQPFFARAVAAKDAPCLALTALVLPAVHPLAPDWAGDLARQMLNP